MKNCPKTTIHVTGIPPTLDRADLKNIFSNFEGFQRICFHSDYVFVSFAEVAQAGRAIEQIHHTTDMLASYAKFGAAPVTAPSISVQPNPILYIRCSHMTSIFPHFTEQELLKIFKSYEGFDSARFFNSHCLVRYRDIECAKRVLENLNSTTNLFANYSTKGTKKTVSVAKSPGQNQSGVLLNGRSNSFSVNNSVNPTNLAGMMNAGNFYNSGTSSASSNASTSNYGSDSEMGNMSVGEEPLTNNNPNSSTVSPSITYPEKPPAIDFQPNKLFGDHRERRGSYSSNTSTSSYHNSHHGGSTISNMSHNTSQPKRTLHVTNFNRSKHQLKCLFASFPGFKKVAFYQDYCFVIFTDAETASNASEELLFKTKLKVSYAKADYVPYVVSASAIGNANSVIRVADYPNSTTEAELIEMFSSYPGYMELKFSKNYSIVFFNDISMAKTALEDMNRTTNFTTTFMKKSYHGSNKMNNAMSSSHPFQQQGNMNMMHVQMNNNNMNGMPNSAPLPQQQVNNSPNPMNGMMMNGMNNNGANGMNLMNNGMNMMNNGNMNMGNLYQPIPNFNNMKNYQMMKGQGPAQNGSNQNNMNPGINLNIHNQRNSVPALSKNSGNMTSSTNTANATSMNGVNIGRANTLPHNLHVSTAPKMGMNMVSGDVLAGNNNLTSSTMSTTLAASMLTSNTAFTNPSSKINTMVFNDVSSNYTNAMMNSKNNKYLNAGNNGNNNNGNINEKPGSSTIRNNNSPVNSQNNRINEKSSLFGGNNNSRYDELSQASSLSDMSSIPSPSASSDQTGTIDNNDSTLLVRSKSFSSPYSPNFNAMTQNSLFDLTLGANTANSVNGGSSIGSPVSAPNFSPTVSSSDIIPPSSNQNSPIINSYKSSLISPSNLVLGLNSMNQTFPSGNINGMSQAKSSYNAGFGSFIWSSSQGNGELGSSNLPEYTGSSNSAVLNNTNNNGTNSLVDLLNTSPSSELDLQAKAVTPPLSSTQISIKYEKDDKEKSNISNSNNNSPTSYNNLFENIQKPTSKSFQGIIQDINDSVYSTGLELSRKKSTSSSLFDEIIGKDMNEILNTTSSQNFNEEDKTQEDTIDDRQIKEKISVNATMNQENESNSLLKDNKGNNIYSFIYIYK